MKTFRYSWISLAYLITISPSWIPFASVACASSAAASYKSTATFSYPPLHGLQPDPLVQSAPLVVAVACRDGVAIVAAASSAHQFASSKSATSFSNDIEPLLFYSASDEIDTSVERTSNATTNNDIDGICPFTDLPDSFTGPYRIQSIGMTGATAFVSCGWKADGYIRLLQTARDLADAERATFGEECNQILPAQLSLFMAQCAVSERFRALSCAALIGYVSDDGNIPIDGINDQSHRSECDDTTKHGCLWFIDATGAYPVYAHCMGGGEVSVTTTSGGKTNDIEKTESTTVHVADVINMELLKRMRTTLVLSKNNTKGLQSRPYFNMTTEEALEVILDLLSSQNSTIKTPSGALLHPGTRLELVSVNCKSQRRKMIHRRVSHVWGRRGKARQVEVIDGIQ